MQVLRTYVHFGFGSVDDFFPLFLLASADVMKGVFVLVLRRVKLALYSAL